MSTDTETAAQQPEIKAKKENKVVRFFVTLIWLVIAVGVDVYAVMSNGYALGAIAEGVFFLITFLVPYLRKKGSYTRWFGWLALLSAAWFAFCMFKG